VYVCYDNWEDNQNIGSWHDEMSPGWRLSKGKFWEIHSLSNDDYISNAIFFDWIIRNIFDIKKDDTIL
jgi:hypothetical protein